MAIAIASAEGSLSSRWTVAGCWLAGLLLYSALIWLTDAETARWVNDVAWTVASASAALTLIGHALSR